MTNLTNDLNAGTDKGNTKNNVDSGKNEDKQISIYAEFLNT